MSNVMSTNHQTHADLGLGVPTLDLVRDPLGAGARSASAAAVLAHT